MLAIEPQYPKLKRGNYRMYGVRLRPVSYRSHRGGMSKSRYEDYLKQEWGHFYFMMKIWNRAAGREEMGVKTPWSSVVYRKLDPLKRGVGPWRRRLKASLLQK